MIKITLIAFFALITTGCATSYQSGAFSFTGGHNETEFSNKITKVDFSGNGFTGYELAHTYAYYRCAEYTKESGKRYFVMYASLIDAVSDKKANEVQVGSIGGKPTAYAYIKFKDEPSEYTHDSKEIMEKYHDIVYPPKITNKKS